MAGLVQEQQQKQKKDNENNNNNNNKPHNYSKFVTDVSMYVNQQSGMGSSMGMGNMNINDSLNGKNWYWFNDSGGFKWIPYKDVDIEKLNSAWRNNQKSCLIINGEYRVEFDRSNPDQPAGNQYNNREQNPGGRTVICSKPKNEIHGIPVAKQPM